MREEANSRVDAAAAGPGSVSPDASSVTAAPRLPPRVESSLSNQDPGPAVHVIAPAARRTEPSGSNKRPLHHPLSLLSVTDGGESRAVVAGELDTPDAWRVREHLDELAEQRSRITLDVAGVSFLEFGAVAVLIGSLVRLHRIGVEVALQPRASVASEVLRHGVARVLVGDAERTGATAAVGTREGKGGDRQ